MFARKLVVKGGWRKFLSNPKLHIIHHGKTCSDHGGLIIYLHENYSWKVRQLHEQSDTWDWIFIGIYGDNLRKTYNTNNVTIANTDLDKPTQQKQQHLSIHYFKH